MKNEVFAKIIIGSTFYRPIMPELGDYPNQGKYCYSYEYWDTKKSQYVHAEKYFDTESERDKMFARLKVQQALDATKKLRKSAEDFAKEEAIQEKMRRAEFKRIRENKARADHVARHGVYEK